MDWFSLGAVVLRRKWSLSEKSFRIFFKLTTTLTNYVFEKLCSTFADINPIHFLWTLHFMKTRNPSIEQIAQLLGTSPTTLMDNVNIILTCLESALPPAVCLSLIFSFENSF